MDVVDTWADFVGVVEIAKSSQQFHVRTAGFDGDYVRVHRRNRGQDIVEFGIAHVSMNLRGVSNTRGGHAKRVARPLQIAQPVDLAQWQAFAIRGLVDLDRRNPRALQIDHLVADRQRDLQCRGGARLVVAHKRPLQNRHGSGQHAFHRLGRQRLCIRGPFDCHRCRARHVAVNDRRLDTATAVALHPAILRERKPVELLAEVFDHVVTFGFTVH